MYRMFTFWSCRACIIAITFYMRIHRIGIIPGPFSCFSSGQQILLLCSVQPTRIALAILAEAKRGLCFSSEQQILLLCSVQPTRIALAILAEAKRGLCFSSGQQILLLCSVQPTRIALAILAEAKRGLCFYEQNKL